MTDNSVTKLRKKMRKKKYPRTSDSHDMLKSHQLPDLFQSLLRMTHFEILIIF